MDRPEGDLASRLNLASRPPGSTRLLDNHLAGHNPILHRRQGQVMNA